MDMLKIKSFLRNNGDGYSNGYGDGDGYSNGYGYGDGYSNGYGDGNGHGYGDGYGYGSGIKHINGYDVYKIDEVPTVLTHIHGNVAKGYILKNNAILKPCYIVKGNGYFAHGETLKKAQSALEEKNHGRNGH